MEDSKYVFIEGIDECNLCYETFKKYFKCKRYVFFSCPKCLNNYYFLEDDTHCLMCSFSLPRVKL